MSALPLAPEGDRRSDLRWNGFFQFYLYKKYKQVLATVRKAPLGVRGWVDLVSPCVRPL